MSACWNNRYIVENINWIITSIVFTFDFANVLLFLRQLRLIKTKDKIINININFYIN